MSLAGNDGNCWVIWDIRGGSLGVGGTWGRVMLFSFSSWLKRSRHNGAQGMRMRQAFNASHLRGTESRMTRLLHASGKDRFIHLVRWVAEVGLHPE